jgi:hypothetical protein
LGEGEGAGWKLAPRGPTLVAYVTLMD